MVLLRVGYQSGAIWRIAFVGPTGKTGVVCGIAFAMPDPHRPGWLYRANLAAEAMSGMVVGYHDRGELICCRVLGGDRMNVTAILFEGFETLDMFGPVEMLGASGAFEVRFYSLDGGIVTSYQGVPVQTEKLGDAPAPEVLLLPGGMGVYDMLEDAEFISVLAALSGRAQYVLSVCNGAFLYAKAGVLDGRRATTYKARMSRAEEMFPEVKWEHTARWTVDGNLYVSSGVSAGTDMALGFIADVCGRECAEKTARYAEYSWNSDPAHDPFAC